MDAATRDIHARDRWILEGGHDETGRERAARAHLLIWLDPHSLLQGWRVFHRSLRHHRKVRPCMAEGWPECFGLHTIDVIRYAWQSRPFHQERVREIIATAPPGLRIRRLGSGRQARRFLSRCAGAAQGSRPAGPPRTSRRCRGPRRRRAGYTISSCAAKRPFFDIFFQDLFGSGSACGPAIALPARRQGRGGGDPGQAS